MLRSLTGRKGEIARCMAFSLEHSDAVTEVRALHDLALKILNINLSGGRNHHKLPLG